jgi:disulfide bond formation protein DsbB
MSVRSSIDWLANLPERRWAWLALAASGLALEGCALYFQYVLELQPCVLCIYIRLATLGLIAAGLIGAIAPSRPALHFVGFAAWGVAAALGLSLSRELIAVQEAGPYSFEVSCSFMPRFPAWMPLHEWFPAFLMPTGNCTDEVWSWLGLSMAQWTKWIFVAYLVALALVVAARLAKRRSIARSTHPA